MRSTLDLATAIAAFVIAFTADVGLCAGASGSSGGSLGLLRLQSGAGPGDAAPLAAGRFDVDALSAAHAPGGANARRNAVDVLQLPAGVEWSRPLRGNSREVTFASVHACVSQSTIIEVGGARLGVTASASDGCLQLMYDDA